MRLRVRALICVLFFASSSVQANCISDWLTRKWSTHVAREAGDAIRAKTLYNVDVSKIEPARLRWVEKIKTGELPTKVELMKLSTEERLGYASALMDSPEHRFANWEEFILNGDPAHVKKAIDHIEEILVARKTLGITYHKKPMSEAEAQDLLIEAHILTNYHPDVYGDATKLAALKKMLKNRFWPEVIRNGTVRDQNIQAMWVQGGLIPKLINQGVIKKSHPVTKGVYKVLKIPGKLWDATIGEFYRGMQLVNPKVDMTPILSTWRSTLNKDTFAKIVDYVEQGKMAEAQALYDSKFKPDFVRELKLKQIPLEHVDLGWANTKRVFYTARNFAVAASYIAAPLIWYLNAKQMQEMEKEMGLGRDPANAITDLSSYIGHDWSELYQAIWNDQHYPTKKRKLLPLDGSSESKEFFEDFVDIAVDIGILKYSDSKAKKEALYNDLLYSYRLIELFQVTAGAGMSPENTSIENVKYYLAEMSVIEPAKSAYYKDLYENLGNDSAKTLEAQTLFKAALDKHLIPKFIPGAFNR